MTSEHTTDRPTDAATGAAAPPTGTPTASRPGGPLVDRRTVLATAGVAAGAVLVAACGGGSGGGSGGDARGDGAASGGGPGAGTTLARLADVPVGGAVPVKAGGRPAIVSRPSPDHVVAFSAICTHQGCTVAPSGKQLVCPCHGSRYDAATGQVLGGPAPRPLSPIAVRVQGAEIVTA